MFSWKSILYLRFFNTIAYSAFFPFLSYYAVHIFHFSLLQTSLLWIIYIIFSKFITIILSPLVHHISWKPILFLSRALGSFGYGITLIHFPSFIFFIIAVIFIGSGSAFYEVSSTYLFASLNTNKQHMWIYSLINLLIAFASVIGFFMNTVLSIPHVLILATVIYGLASIFLFILSYPISCPAPNTSHSTSVLSTSLILTKSSYFWFLQLLAILGGYLTSSYYIFLPLQLETIGWNEHNMVLFFSVQVLLSALLGYIFSKITWISNHKLLVLSLLLISFGISYATLNKLQDSIYIFLGLFILFYSLGLSLYYPLIKSLFTSNLYFSQQKISLMIGSLATSWAVGNIISACIIQVHTHMNSIYFASSLINILIGSFILLYLFKNKQYLRY